MGKFHPPNATFPLRNGRPYEGVVNNNDWLVVSTHLKNTCQNGNLPQIVVKNKKICETTTQNSSRSPTKKTNANNQEPLCHKPLIRTAIFVGKKIRQLVEVAPHLAAAACPINYWLGGFFGPKKPRVWGSVGYIQHPPKV